MEPVNLAALERAARERLDPGAWDYIAGGAEDESTLAANVAAWGRYRFVPRVLVDVSRRELASRALGVPISMPVGVAPTAFHRLAHPEGEVATARAAAAVGVPFVLSSLSTRTIEDVAAASAGLKWFQLYVYKDRPTAEKLVARAEAAGFAALVLTVDAPVLGRRERSLQSGYEIPFAPANFDVAIATGGSGAAMLSPALGGLDPSLSWRDLAWLVARTGLPVVVKGVLHPDDAVQAIEHGASAIVVSNHGGRQLDGAIATADALPDVVAAVHGRVPVWVDGGIRRGTDVLRALAMGAEGVLVGRPVVYGLAVGGEAGARGALEALRRELDAAMALCGATDIAAARRVRLVTPGGPPR